MTERLIQDIIPLKFGMRRLRGSHRGPTTFGKRRMNQDISELLQAWEFDPEANVRKIRGDDGVEKMQVRVDQGAFQGILQVNLDGRPDGRRPHGMDYALDYFRSLLEQSDYQREKRKFSLDKEACQELFDEGSRIYGRYIFLLQLKDYDRVIRDTERNMELFRFVNTYGEEEEDRLNMEKWWPYILRIHAVAGAMKATEKEDFDGALDIVEKGREQIKNLPEVEAEEFFVELERSQQALDELAEELHNKKPLSQREILEQRLQEAIDSEEFERAAVIRDELKKLEESDPAPSG